MVTLCSVKVLVFANDRLRLLSEVSGNIMEKTLQRNKKFFLPFTWSGLLVIVSKSRSREKSRSEIWILGSNRSLCGHKVTAPTGIPQSLLSFAASQQLIPPRLPVALLCVSSPALQQAFLTTQIWTCHSKKSTSVPDNTNDGSVLFKWSSERDSEPACTTEPWNQSS